MQATSEKTHRALTDPLAARACAQLSLASSYLLAGATPFAPSIDEKILLAELLTQELGLMETLLEAHPVACASRTLVTIDADLNKLAWPVSWPESCIAIVLIQQALALAVNPMVVDSEQDAFHAGPCLSILIQACHGNAFRHRVDLHVEKWYRLAAAMLPIASERSIVSTKVRYRELISRILECCSLLPS
jgi:hypothetical protein